MDFVGVLRGGDERKVETVKEEVENVKEEVVEKKEIVKENDQKTEFELACEYAKNNLNSFSDKDKLKMYGLYKQATKGPNNTKEPSMLKPVAKYKWKAWKQCSSLSREEATRAYVEFVGLLRGDDKKVEDVKEEEKSVEKDEKSVEEEEEDVKEEEEKVEDEKNVKEEETTEEKTSSPLEHHHATTIQRHYRGYRFRSSHHNQLQHDHRYDLCRILLITDLSEECDDEVAFEVLVRGLAKIKDCNFLIELLVPDARERLQWFATVFEEHFRKGDWRWYVVFNRTISFACDFYIQLNDPTQRSNSTIQLNSTNSTTQTGTHPRTSTRRLQLLGNSESDPTFPFECTAQRALDVRRYEITSHLQQQNEHVSLRVYPLTRQFQQTHPYTTFCGTHRYRRKSRPRFSRPFNPVLHFDTRTDPRNRTNNNIITQK